MEATIKTIATKDDLGSLKDDFTDLRQYIRDTHKEIIQWMFVFWLGQVAATVIIFSLLF